MDTYSQNPSRVVKAQHSRQIHRKPYFTCINEVKKKRNE